MSRTTLFAPARRPFAGPVLALAAALTVCGSTALAQGARLRVGDQAEYSPAKKVLVFPVGEEKDLSVLWLRPNARGQFFLFVENPAAVEGNFRVRLVGADKRVVAASDIVPVAEKKTAPVTLTLPAAPKPPPGEPPAKPATPPKEPAPEGIEGRGLPPQFRLELLEVTLKKGETKPTAERVVDTVRIDILRPARYLTVRTAEYESDFHRLTVAVKANEFLAGEPCALKMTVQLPDVKTGKMVDFVPAKGAFTRTLSAGDEVELFAEDEEFGRHGEGSAQITISADDYGRAFRYEVSLKAKAGLTAAKPLTDPEVMLDCPGYAVPGGPLLVRAAVDNIGKLPGSAQALSQVDTEVSIRLQLGRLRGKDKLDPYLSKVLRGHRDQHVYLNPQGSDGAVTFQTAVRDWEVELPTRGVFGEIRVRAQGIDADDKVVEVKVPERSAYPLETLRPLVLDGIRPSIVSGSPVDEELPKGQPLRVRARVKAPPSGLRSVAFFTGALAPDPKVPGAFLIPEGAARVMGKHLAKEDKDGTEVWEAALAELPTDKPAKVEVVVEAVSNAGLKDLGRFEVKLKESVPGAPGAGPQLGSIKGKVMEGMRAQAKLTVVLKDVMGAVKADATTNDAGEYEFKDLPPGPYVVSSAKKKSATKGETPVQVKAGKEAVADISLLR